MGVQASLPNPAVNKLRALAQQTCSKQLTISDKKDRKGEKWGNHIIECANQDPSEIGHKESTRTVPGALEHLVTLEELSCLPSSLFPLHLLFHHLMISRRDPIHFNF